MYICLGAAANEFAFQSSVFGDTDFTATVTIGSVATTTTHPLSSFR
jgi:hypothetical protein